MNSIKISLVNFGFGETVEVKKYRNKLGNRVTLRKYDTTGNWLKASEERRYE